MAPSTSNRGTGRPRGRPTRGRGRGGRSTREPPQAEPSPAPTTPPRPSASTRQLASSPLTAPFEEDSIDEVNAVMQSEHTHATPAQPLTEAEQILATCEEEEDVFSEDDSIPVNPRTTEEWARVPAPVRIGNSEYTVTIFSDRTVALGFGLPVHGGFSVLTRDPPTEPPVEELPPLLPQAEDDEPSEPLAMDEWVHMERLEHDPVVMRVELPPPPPLKKEGRRLTPDEVRRLRPLLKIRDQVLAGCAPVSDVFASDPGFWLANRTPPPSPPASPPRKRQKRMGISDKENIPVCEPSAARVPEFKTSTSSGLRPAPSVPALKEEVKFVFEQPSTGGSIAKNDKGKARATRPTDSDDDYDPTDDSDDDYQEPSGSSRKRKPLCDANTLTPTLEILRSTVPCPMTGCQHVFDSKACGDAVVTKHLASCHRSTLVVPYKIPCPVDGCKSVFLCPKREQYENRIKNVGRHMRTAHMHPYRLLCPFKKCTYRINRKSSMVRHLSSTNNKNHI